MVNRCEVVAFFCGFSLNFDLGSSSFMVYLYFILFYFGIRFAISMDSNYQLLKHCG